MLTERQLKLLVNKWRRRLGIEDWKLVSIRYDDTIENAWAEIDIEDFNERISIRLHPEPPPEGEEFCIVHELIHVVLRKLKGKHEDEELAINKLARALSTKRCRKTQTSAMIPKS